MIVEVTQREGHEGLPREIKNEEEMNYPGVRAMPFIIGYESCEKLGSQGLTAGLHLYLSRVMNMKPRRATTIINVFNSASNLATLPAAYLSDTFFGRYNTLAFGSAASFLGFVAIALMALINKLHPPKCGVQCVDPTAWQLAFLFVGLGLLITGAGAIRPSSLAFGVDQFNPNTQSGKRGADRYINWYFMATTAAKMISLILILYVQTNISWGIGLSIPAILMLMACSLLLYGTKVYAIVRPGGSPLGRLTQVVVVAIKKRRLQLPQQPCLNLFNYLPPKSLNSKLPYTHQFRFLDKAAIVTGEDEISPDGSAADPWKLCSMQQVEEVKCILRVIPIWTTTFLYHVGQTQQYLVYQAMQSDRHLGPTTFQIPSPSFSFVSMLTLVLWLPIYNTLLAPFLRITMLQRIGFGLFLTIIESLLSAFVEQRRRSLPSMSAMWLVPQQFVAGVAEAFSGVGQVEFFYKQFPESMRSVSGSLFFLGLAVGYYLNNLLIMVVHWTTEKSPAGNWLPDDLNKGKLHYFYYLVTGLCVFNFCYFVVCAKWFKYRDNGTVVLGLGG